MYSFHSGCSCLSIFLHIVYLIPPSSFSLPLFPYLNPFPTYMYLSQGNISLNGLRQIGGKLHTGIFGNHVGGIGGDSDAVEALFKEYLPECLNMNDVAYPRYGIF